MHGATRCLSWLALVSAVSVSCSSDRADVPVADAGADGTVPLTDSAANPMPSVEATIDLDSTPSSGGRAGTDGAADLDAANDGPPTDGAELASDATSPAVRPNVDRSNPDLHEFTLDPAALDPAASDFLADQFAQLDTRAEPLGKLVFFLPGANNSPADWRNHGRKLAEFGFHVLIPHYNNGWGNACSGQGNTCNRDTRWEALTGEDVSSVIDVSPADSAEGRVIAMLTHLQVADPGGDWGFYLDAALSLHDARVIIAGISHGATSSGLFASRRSFWRVVMHSGGYGAVGDNPATPLSAYYGLSHTDDSQHAAHLTSWESANLPGSPTPIDGQPAPFGGAHQLITSEPNTYPHCSVVVHSSSPTDASGGYVFEPAWRYLYGVTELAR